MSTIEEQLTAIEKEIRETPYHKGTEHHIGKLRARLARLRDKQIETTAKKGGGGGGYAVKKQGDATVVLVGPPSVGKSTLINKLTNANSRVAPYAFTTVSVIPGMMQYKDAYIQILDVPGLIEGAAEGKGRGREVLSVVRGSDLLIIMSDIDTLHLLPIITASLERNGIRINRPKPDVRIEKKTSGGLAIHTNIAQEMSKETIKEVAMEMGLKNAEIFINERLTLDRLTDVFSKNRAYIPALYVVNKADTTARRDFQVPGETFFISAEHDSELGVLREAMWEQLGFVRVYLVRPDAEPSSDDPIIMHEGNTLKDVARQIGPEFAEHKRAKIWGSGAKFAAQEVSLATPIVEGMQVRFV